MLNFKRCASLQFWRQFFTFLFRLLLFIPRSDFLGSIILPAMSTMPSRRAASLWLAITTAVGVTSAFQLPDIINRDVVIVGGGASGAYAAVRLRDDYGKSIALVEIREGLVRKKAYATH